MSTATSQSDHSRRSLRIWPGVLIVGLQWGARFLLPLVVPDMEAVSAIAALAGGLGLMLWWAFLSRAPVGDRLLGVGLFVVSLVGVRFLAHESIQTGGMGVLFFVYAVPVACLAFLVWAYLSQHAAAAKRRVWLLIALLVAGGVWLLFRTAGITAGADSDFEWRWAKTPEQRLLDESATPQPLADEELDIEGLDYPNANQLGQEWPGFRGAQRDAAAYPGFKIETNWIAQPPKEIWRSPVGPGWSSFAVRGGLIYTQEQRGENEATTSYRADSGELVWMHQEPVRFWESNAGAGPRGTPALGQQRVFSLGATGLLNALDARTGDQVWMHDAAQDSGTTRPNWGYSGSPLVVSDRVIVALSGMLLAYDEATGELLWKSEDGGVGYGSPHLVKLGESVQMLLMSADGLMSVSPETGETLWQHVWDGFGMTQPALTDDGDLVFGATAEGTRRIKVVKDGAGWNSLEEWSSKGLKPYFNGIVVHEGHAYGFDGRILSCLNLRSGERVWKGGRYGNGQLLLLPEQDLLLVLAEDGRLALVDAQPTGFKELGSMAALTGKSWNHLALSGSRLFVRNDQEMAAFELPQAN